MKKLKHAMILICLLVACTRYEADVVPGSFNQFELRDFQFQVFAGDTVAFALADSLNLQVQSYSLTFAQPRLGQLLADSQGVYRYGVGLGIAGRDTVPYTVCASGHCQSALLVFFVADTVVPCSPLARPDSVLVPFGSPATVQLLANDDTCSLMPTIGLIGAPASVVLQGGLLTVPPNTAATSPATFRYSLCYGSTCSEATITVNYESRVAFCDALLRATDDTLIFRGGTFMPIDFEGLLANDRFCNDKINVSSSRIRKLNPNGPITLLSPLPDSSLAVFRQQSGLVSDILVYSIENFSGKKDSALVQITWFP